MKKLFAAWLAVALLGLTAFADVPSGKWVSLFNGTNLNGWAVMNGGKFSVTNGALQIDGGMGWLRSERAFTNFVVEVEWRGLETNYNSGIFLRAGLAGNPMPTNGWQANLKQADLGAWLKNKGIQFSPQSPIVPVGEWAKFTLEAHGTNATLWLNSQKLWTHGFDATSGFIGIQAEEKRMELRSLRVLELPQNADLTPKSVLDVMQRVADWQLANPSKHKPTDWTQGAGDAGMMALAGISGDAKYRDAMLAMGATNDWQLGPQKFHADDHAVGQTYAELYFLYREPKMIAPLRERFDFILANQPTNTNLDFSQKDHGQLRWSWCDALFMGPPAWVRLYYATGDQRYLDFGVAEWWRTSAYLYDTNEHLYFRDSTYFDKREANGKKIFWSRGNGWVMGGLVRTLQYLPMNHPERPRFEQQFQEMCAKILACQQPDGLWRASLLDPDSYPLKETSGSGFYTYALAWGVNQGLLDKAQYEPAVRKAWAALVNCVDADGKLTHVQPIGADPKKFAEDSTEVYGVGAFLLAGSEVYRMAVLESPPADTGKIIPLAIFRDVPLKVVITNLTMQAGIKCSFDSDIRGELEADVAVRWTDLTGKQALQMVLENHGLQIVQNSNGDSFHISKSSTRKSIQHFSSPIILKIKNPATFSRVSETIEFNLDDIHGYSVLNFPTLVMDGFSSRILDSQLYVSGTNQAAGKLLFQVDLAPDETRTFYILDAAALAAVPPPIVKTFARFVPERMDDFAWESDRIAHRMYGPALIKGEGTISSGVDAWVKRTRNLVINKWYKSGDYHKDHGEGLDGYTVSHNSVPTRGCGGLGIWDGKKLWVSSNFVTQRLITTGPIRSEFELTYDAWDAAGRKVSEVKRMSIDANANFTRVQSTFTADGSAPLTVGIGIADRGTNDVEASDVKAGWLAYWEPVKGANGNTACALVVPGGVSEFTKDGANLLAIAPATPGQPFVYYLGAGWSKSGDFAGPADWENCVKHFAERLAQPLQVTVGN